MKETNLLTKKKHGNITHGMTNTRLFRIWRAMRQRCLNPNNRDYFKYGGRGITICKRWLDSFELFLLDMEESYLLHCEKFGEIQTSIDRINNNGNYESSNCKWATKIEQGSNTRQNKLFKAFSPNGEEFISNNQSQFAREHNMCREGIKGCLNGYHETYLKWKFIFI